MGAALSDCLHPPELTLDKPWMSWDSHPQARLYVRAPVLFPCLCLFEFSRYYRHRIRALLLYLRTRYWRQVCAYRIICCRYAGSGQKAGIRGL